MCLIKVDEIINKFHAKWIEVSFTVRIGFFFLKHDCRLQKNTKILRRVKIGFFLYRSHVEYKNTIPSTRTFLQHWNNKYAPRMGHT